MSGRWLAVRGSCVAAVAGATAPSGAVVLELVGTVAVVVVETVVVGGATAVVSVAVPLSVVGETGVTVVWTFPLAGGVVAGVVVTTEPVPLAFAALAFVLRALFRLFEV
jgi:hypothetical protein